MKTAERPNPPTAIQEIPPITPGSPLSALADDLAKKLSEANRKIAQMELRDEIWVLADLIPLEPTPDQKQAIHVHYELGFAFTKDDIEKAARNRSVKPVAMKLAV